ncbi:hypothetical protein [Shewanella phage FishSpeaker]|nr:hypothetical protein [Shewanella phage FishSpeaker]
MAITLHFDNPNPEGVKLEIFRDTAHIDRANLPAPIATILTHADSWTDVTAIKGATYYYVFKTTGAVDSKLTRNLEVIALDDKGVGNDKLYFGNLDYGYYGNVLVSSFFTGAQLISALGMTFPLPGTAITMWHKFAYKGKTVFVPNSFVGKGLSYNELVAAGLREGKIVQYGQFQYRVRLMKGFDPNRNFGDFITMNNGSTDTALLPDFDSEFDRLVYPLSRYIPVRQATHNVDYRNMAELGYATSTWFVMAELNGDASLCLTRGTNTETAVGLTTAVALTPATKVNGVAFLPILELITDQV